MHVSSSPPPSPGKVSPQLSLLEPLLSVCGCGCALISPFSLNLQPENLQKNWLREFYQVRGSEPALSCSHLGCEYLCCGVFMQRLHLVHVEGRSGCHQVSPRKQLLPSPND